MSLKVELGLFNLDFTDYHAILGVPVNADIKEIRKQYLQIARRLHPDSRSTGSEEDRQRAAELLSKLVNPAYEKLSQEKNYTEYCVLLNIKGQQASRQQETVILVSEPARNLASARGDIDLPYREALRELVKKQYEQLGKALELTGHISELNMVYLMRKAKQGEKVPPPSKQLDPSKPGGTGKETPAPPGDHKRRPVDPLEGYIRRAEEFERKGDYINAVRELRDAIKINASNSGCHSRLGRVYFKSKQLTMAKIEFNQALKLNPKDPIALEGLTQLEQANSTPPAKGGKSAPKADKSVPKGDKGKSDGSGGGLFGLFGGKKK